MFPLKNTSFKPKAILCIMLFLLLGRQFEEMNINENGAMWNLTHMIVISINVVSIQ